jgi:hypothetical protein
LANDTHNYAAGLTADERALLRLEMGVHGVQSDDLHLYGLGVDWREHARNPELVEPGDDWGWFCDEGM